jgi:SAM-dependent methyltransferase
MPIDVRDYADYLKGLYQQQLREAHDPYLSAHSRTDWGIVRQVKAAQLYLPFVTGRVLDWGCFHAPDACMVRKYLGPKVEIHGCDYHPPNLLSVFHQAAQLEYRQVKHPYHVPYDDNFFDTVIADGVLEHVSNDFESLKELFRVLKPDGMLIISCLPNSLSYLEAFARWFRLPHHLRSYSMRSARQLLLNCGFQPIYSCRLQMTPSLSGAAMFEVYSVLRAASGVLVKINSLLESIWPINIFASNLFLLARKRLAFTWSRASLEEWKNRRHAA